jgi:hypothetical protein
MVKKMSADKVSLFTFHSSLLFIKETPPPKAEEFGDTNAGKLVNCERQMKASGVTPDENPTPDTPHTLHPKISVHSRSFAVPTL